MTDYVLDTSALLALFKDEEGAQEVEEILDTCKGGKSKVYLPFMSIMEFDYQVLRSRGRTAVDGALRMIQAWPIETVESNPEWGRKAAWVKSRAGLSVADAWNAALALLLGAELVHKDPEFDQVHSLKHRRLPYKKT
ncbi:MAG TPA: PIN domain-containing protein [Thermoanaerobaculia bacterium]